MRRPPLRVLVADTGAAERDVRAALGEDATRIAVHSLEEATARLQERGLDLIVVGYHFDELRSFRLIRYARAHFGGGTVPILLLRALPIRLGATSEAQLREAYRALGVNAFFNFFDEAQSFGRAAAADKLRRLVPVGVSRRPPVDLRAAGTRLDHAVHGEWNQLQRAERILGKKRRAEIDHADDVSDGAVRKGDAKEVVQRAVDTGVEDLQDQGISKSGTGNGHCS